MNTQERLAEFFDSEKARLLAANGGRNLSQDAECYLDGIAAAEIVAVLHDGDDESKFRAIQRITAGMGWGA